MRRREAEDGPEVQKTERRNQGEEQQLLVEKEADDIKKKKKNPHLEHERPCKFVDLVCLFITNIPRYIEMLSQCTMQVGYKAGEQS